VSSQSSANGSARDRTARGETLYSRYCARCHGNDGRGARAERQSQKELPDFTRHSWHERRSDTLLVTSIQDGKGKSMPSFAEKLGKQQIQDLVGYIRKFDPSPRKSRKASASDFDKHFQELEKEFEALQKELRESAKPPRKR
jgi:mono/diheme cytochrome c family protein